MGKCLLGDKQPTSISHSLNSESNLHYGNQPTNKIQHHLLDKNETISYEEFLMIRQTYPLTVNILGQRKNIPVTL